MDIISFIKNLFNNKSTGIINYYDIFTIPNRSILDSNKINKLEEYKNKYSSILSSKKYLISKNIELDNIFDLINMYTELLLNNISIEEENIEKSKIYKLKYYVIEIERLREELLIRLIALNELKHKVILPNKRNVINNEINKLILSFTTCNSQKTSINNEIKTYLDNGKIIEESNINKKIEELIKYINIIYLEKNINVDYSSKSIASLEILLESYVFNNKNDVNTLKEELRRINESIDNTDKNVLLNEINELENKYIIFHKYGRNVVTDKDLNYFYNIKFNILTKDINNGDIPLFENKNILSIKYIDFEDKVYQDIISDKINLLVKGESLLLKKIKEKYKDPIMYSKIISYASNILKKNNIYDVENIMHIPSLFAFLLAFDKEDGLDKFFSEFKITNPSYKRNYQDREFYRDKLHSNIFKWNDLIPLESLCKLSILSLQCSELLNPLFENIYNTLHLYDDKSIYKIPEGIKCIHYYLDNSSTDYEYLSKISKCNIIITPSTLTTLFLKNNSTNKLNEIKLNEGLKNVHILEKIKIITLTIPSSLNILNSPFAYGNYLYADKLYFENYKESNLLFDREKLKDFIKSVYKKYIIFNEVINEKISDGIYRNKIKYISIITNTVSKFIFLSDDNPIIIDPSIYNFKSINESYTYELNDEEINRIMDELYKSLGIIDEKDKQKTLKNKVSN